MTLAVVGRSRLLDLDTFSRAAATHPDLVRRLVALGLLEPEPVRTGQLWFAPAQLIALARIQRLRAGLGLNYAAIGVVIDLLDRVTVLERELRQSTSRPTGGRPWT
jgi:pimeloyl-ACP methyl ester carboxylesterase